MNNKEFARKLEERTRKFAVQIIRLSNILILTCGLTLTTRTLRHKDTSQAFCNLRVFVAL
jgi:hypothetical protein